MATTKRAVADWLDRYIQAWRTYRPGDIGDLFNEAAQYRYQPYDEPVRGRDAIVASWLDERDPAGSWQATYQPIAIDDDLAVVTGRTVYLDAGGSPREEFWNCWVLRFDDDGRCTEFTEWYMQPEGTEAE